MIHRGRPVGSAVANQGQLATRSAAAVGCGVNAAARPGSPSLKWCFAGRLRCCGSASLGGTSALARAAAVSGGRVHSVTDPSSPSARRCFPRSFGCCGWASLGGTSALIRSPRNWSYRGVVLTGDTVGAGRRGRHPHRVYRWGRLCSGGGHRVGTCGGSVDGCQRQILDTHES